MKLEAVKCPNCGGKLFVDGDYWICESCRGIFADTDTPEETIHTRNVNVRNDHYHHEVDHAEIEKEKNKHDIHDNITFLLAMVIICAGIIIMGYTMVKFTGVGI